MKNTMLAAVFEGDGQLSLKEEPIPQIRKDDDVLLKVEAASICGTDVHILEVPPGHPATKGIILGHEYVGQVVEVGNNLIHVKPGDRVVVDPNVTCGFCVYCRTGLPNMCENMTTLGIFINGGFAEYNVAPAKALHKISSDLPAELAVFAEPLSCVVNGMRKLQFRSGESAVVLGAGPIGLYFTQLFKAAGAGKIIVAEPNEFRGKFARDSGADVVVNPVRENLEQIVKEETGIGTDVVVDAVGSLILEAIKMVRRGGKVLLFGMNERARAEIAQNDITRREIQILGTYIANATFPPTIKILENKILPLEKLITHRLVLQQIHEGIELMRKGEAIEIVINPTDALKLYRIG